MKVDTRVLAVLDHCKADGHVLKLADQLPRKDYELVNKTLEAAGGKWNRKAGGHVFDGDAGEILRQLQDGVEFATQNELGAFFTPPEVVRLVMQRADVREWQLCLEPSAGIGNIAKEAAGITAVDCVELQERYCDILEASDLYQHVQCADFLALEPAAIYDRVVMNPPFARQADIDHVQHALKFVKPGGRLVSIMLASLTFRENKKTLEFKDLVLARGGTIEALPEQAFKGEGTEVSTLLVTIPG